MDLEALRYPLGQFKEVPLTAAVRAAAIEQLAALPAQARAAVAGLSDAQLDTPYRPGGWTVRQVVHHLADAHLHSYIRTKFAQAENEPTIMPFDENAWANLKDAKSGPIEPSLLLLDGVQSRWAQTLESLSEADWSRKFVHPLRGPTTQSAHVPVYAWHGRHHTAHITELRKRMGWG